MNRDAGTLASLFTPCWTFYVNRGIHQTLLKGLLPAERVDAESVSLPSAVRLPTPTDKGDTGNGARRKDLTGAAGWGQSPYEEQKSGPAPVHLLAASPPASWEGLSILPPRAVEPVPRGSASPSEGRESFPFTPSSHSRSTSCSFARSSSSLPLRLSASLFSDASVSFSCSPSVAIFVGMQPGEKRKAGD